MCQQGGTRGRMMRLEGREGTWSFLLCLEPHPVAYGQMKGFPFTQKEDGLACVSVCVCACVHVHVLRRCEVSKIK